MLKSSNHGVQVRKTIEIGVVFERLMTKSSDSNGKPTESTGKWSHVDLIKYLASVRSDIPAGDIKRLRSTPICPAELDLPKVSNQLYLISDLFEPKDSLRHLSLPILQWPGVYHSETMEGRFLTYLGLRGAPSYMEIINIMSTADAAENFPLRHRALRYFIDYHQANGYASFDHKTVNTPYLPLQDTGTRLATPSTCFSNERASIMGFDVLSKELHMHAIKFGVQADPPILECVNRLIKNPPESRRSAREVFCYFAGRLAEINSQHVESLSGAPIVPVVTKSTTLDTEKSEKTEHLRRVPPRVCFLGDGDRYAEIFDYVDFGQEANTFLLRCGSKHEPSTAELALLLTQQPARVFTILEIPRYLELLRSLAHSWRTLRKDKALAKEMSRASFLLASREVPSKATKIEHDDDDEASVRTYELADAAQIVVVDDMISYNLFKTNLLAAPMEETLEDFYSSLGSPDLGSLVEEQHSIGDKAADQTTALNLQQLVRERSRLFLHDQAPGTIKHDAKWIEKHLSVIAVRAISLRKSLKGTTLRHNEARTAAIHEDKQRGWVLSITTSGCDMYEVSQVLVPLILNRSKPQHVMMLEILLETDLRKLGARGYNVHRILRQQASEARIAEETRKDQLEQEQQYLRERQAAWLEAQTAATVQRQANMPGVFPNSPDHKRRDSVNQPPMPEENHVKRTPRGVFSGLSDIGKRFGFDNGRRPLSQSDLGGASRDRAKNDGTSEAPPPPYSQQAVEKTRDPIPQPEIVTAPHQLQQK